MKFDYAPVQIVDDESEDGTSTRTKVCRWGFWHLVLHPAVPWTLTLIFASVALFLAMVIDQSSLHRSEGQGTFKDGYATDFVTAKEYIQVEQTRFTGGPAFDDKGGMYVPNPPEKLFVGDPSTHPEIDYNWDNLTWGRYVLITKDEAVATWGEDADQYWDKQRGGYVAGQVVSKDEYDALLRTVANATIRFDMFHTLHCLNNLRKALNPEYYGSVEHISHGGGHVSRGSSTSEPEPPPVHQDHCIEQIRQYIMCSGDITPIGTKYYPGLGRNYVDSDVRHTCRNFDLLHDWMVDRYDGSSAVQPMS